MNENERDDEQQQDPTPQPHADDVDYIEEIRRLKETMVPKKDFDDLRDRNKKLLKAYTEGQRIEEPIQKKLAPDFGKLRKELFDGELNNLDYVSKALELREAIMDQGGQDPFLPNGPFHEANNQDREAVEKVVAVFEHCIEYANGDPEVFTNELSRLTKDNLPPINVRKRGY